MVPGLQSDKYQNEDGEEPANSENAITRTEEPTLPGEELEEMDQEIYLKVISTDLSEKQKRLILNPEKIYPNQNSVLAVHWHPEFISMDLISQRINSMFPNKESELIIPTQHNTFLRYGRYVGAEVDCYSKEFNRKVQLLLHFEQSRLVDADVLKGMLAHTLKYRSTQFFELIHSITEPKWEHRLQEAAAKTGADASLIELLRTHTRKVEKLLLKNESITPVEAIKNKLLSNYFEELVGVYDATLINRILNLIQAVKKIVKVNFSNRYFYRTEAVIEEARSFGAGIVIPHPEQFWPILLAEYDVDGYEVWNPQSREYTEFLINVVTRQNKTKGFRQRPLLIFMGDDTHTSAKLKAPEKQNPQKASREIGLQEAWDDQAISKSLILANTNRVRVIEEYKDRLE